MTSYSWQSAIGGDWNSASNWTPTGGPPDSGDSVTIGVAGRAYTITVDSADAAGSVTLSSADAVLAVDGTAGSLTVGGTFGMSAGFLDIATSSAASGAVTVDGAFTNSGGTLNVNFGGTLTLGGALTQTAGTLDLNWGGTISGGVIDVTGGSVGWDGGTLSGVTYEGPLNLTSSSVSQSVHLAKGSTEVGSSGSGPGTINVTGFYSNLYFDNTQMVGNVTINLGSSDYFDYLVSYDSNGAGDKVLTLASSVTVNASGDGYDYIAAGLVSGDAVVNQGVIRQTGSSYFYIPGEAFTNSGTIDAAGSGAEVDILTTNFTNNDVLNISNGDTVDIAATTFTNLAANTLTGGTYDIGAASTLEVSAGGKIETLDANVILSGTGSQFIDYYSGYSGTPELDTTLTTIGAAGELQWLAGRNWTTANAAITNQGVIELGGGTIKSTGSSASLTDAAGSKLFGYGAVTATTFSNSGTIEASGGTLTLTDSVSGTGALQIDANADLVVGGAIASGATATFSGDDGLITLDAPASFGATVGGFALIDTIDLVGITANAAHVAGNRLVVSENRTAVDTIEVNGAYSNLSFVATPATDGPAGTDIIALPTPATVADYLAAFSDYNLISGGFSISDTASDIAAGLAAIGADLAHLASVTSTSGKVKVGMYDFSNYESVLDRVVGGFVVSDSLAKIVPDIATLDADASVAELIGWTGAATLSGGAAIDAPNLVLRGPGATLTVAENLTYAGAFSILAAAVLSVSAGDALTLTGAATLNSTVSGAGELATDGATATIDSNASIGVTEWTSSGETIDLGGAQSYSGTFEAGAGDTLNANTGALTLKGATSLSGGVTTGGPKALNLDGATTVTGALNIGGRGGVNLDAMLTDSGGNTTLGDAAGHVVKLTIAQGGTWDVTDDSSLLLGESASSSIANAGLFEKTRGTATSTIAPAIANTGTIEVWAATLELQGAITGTGSEQISGAATLELAGRVGADQKVSFSGAGGALELLNPTAFAAKISDFDAGGASGDSLVVASHWTFSKFVENAADTSGTMTLADGAATATLTLTGNYAASGFASSTNASGMTVISYT